MSRCSCKPYNVGPYCAERKKWRVWRCASDFPTVGWYKKKKRAKKIAKLLNKHHEP